jgi:predicted  nucleic acid-binding Zn-ribbon protein
LNAAKKDIFNLQLENHFLKERLSNMAPDHIEAALKENVRLKLEILNISKEMKKVKKLLTQQDRDLAEAMRERDAGGSSSRGGKELRELEGMYKAEKERRKQAEEDLAVLQERGEGDEGLRAKIEDVEASEDVWRQRVVELEEELEGAKAGLEDKDEEMDKIRDEADRAQEEVERLKAGLGESVGLGRGREARMIQKLEEVSHSRCLETTADSQNRIMLLYKLKLRPIEMACHLKIRKRWKRSAYIQIPWYGVGQADKFQRINELRDKLAAAQLDLDRRDAEIDQLNEELDGKVRDHDKEVDQVEAEWRNEVLEARAQIDELKDVSGAELWSVTSH